MNRQQRERADGVCPGSYDGDGCGLLFVVMVLAPTLVTLLTVVA